ncbi:MAG: PadR family transcriptional regulator [Oscillospiraceae bacterium]|nr:PadR family transcriptional regulator [Oscillospiraceae bacterium]
MDVQLKRGLLDACVLRLLETGESYGYKITQDMSGIVKLSESTLYPVLRRMEQQGCLRTRQQAYGGRLRKYYAITNAGAARLAQFQQEWCDVQKIVNFAMKREESV